MRVVTSLKSTLRAVKGDTVLDIPCEDGFSGTSHTQEELEEFEAVFVGHGITAPEFGWDDYKDADVKGKVVVLFTNEPPSNDPKFFGGTAPTYYGRWTYKFEKAARRGGKGMLHHPYERNGGVHLFPCPAGVPGRWRPCRPTRTAHHVIRNAATAVPSGHVTSHDIGRSVGRWRSDLPSVMQSHCNRELAQCLRTFGYEAA